VVLDRRSVWGEDRVYFDDDEGRLRRMPIAWTSLAMLTPFEILSAGRSYFRVNDLLQLAGLIARLSDVSEVRYPGGVKQNTP